MAAAVRGTLPRDRRGAVAILFALAMPVLIGFLALGTEVGVWYLERRQMQTAADMAAIAGAYERLAGSDDEVATAEQEAAHHGFSMADGRTTVEVNWPPTQGAAAGDDAAVEVVITRTRALLFAAMFSSDPVAISVRAAARMDGTSTACVLALDPSAYRAVDVTGTADLSMPTCTLAANSTNAEAIAIRGNADVEALTLTTSGDYAVSGSGTLTTGTPPRTGVPPLLNPYVDRPLPPASPCTQTSYQRNQSSPVTIAPGRYCSGMSFGAQSVVDFSPGTYVVDGGSVTINAGATLSCSGCSGGQGVTIVLTGSGSDYATVRINGDATITLRAPTSGSYAGLLFFQDPAAPSGGSNLFNGGAAMTLTGALYFPNQSIAFRGNATSNTSSCTQLVARLVSFTGTASVGSDCDGTGVETINAGGTIRLVD